MSAIGTYKKLVGTTLYLRGTPAEGYEEYIGRGVTKANSTLTKVMVEEECLLPKDIGRMFYGCSSLTSLDLSNFDTSQVTAMSGMFKNCSNLLEITVDKFDTSNVTDSTDMFFGCVLLPNYDSTKIDKSMAILTISGGYLTNEFVEVASTKITYSKNAIDTIVKELVNYVDTSFATTEEMTTMLEEVFN